MCVAKVTLSSCSTHNGAVAASLPPPALLQNPAQHSFFKQLYQICHTKCHVSVLVRGQWTGGTSRGRGAVCVHGGEEASELAPHNVGAACQHGALHGASSAVQLLHCSMQTN